MNKFDNFGLIPDPQDDRRAKFFRLKNSWGVNWGARGFARISYYHVKRCLLDAWGVL